MDYRCHSNSGQSSRFSLKRGKGENLVKTSLQTKNNIRTYSQYLTCDLHESAIRCKP